MDIQIVDFITLAVIGLSFWCFSIMTKLGHDMKNKFIKQRMFDTEDVIAFIVSSSVFIACVFVLWVEPGLISKLPSVFTAIVTGAFVLVYYIGDLRKCKKKHHHYIR